MEVIHRLKKEEVKKEKNACKDCKHKGIDGDDYSNWGYFTSWPVCDITSFDNLKSFPFIATNCKKFKKK